MSAREKGTETPWAFQSLAGLVQHTVARISLPVNAGGPSLLFARTAMARAQTEANLCSDDPGSGCHPPELVVASFYEFAELPHCDEIRQQLQQLCHEQVP